MRTIAALILSAASAAGAAAQESQRPMHEMQGDCANYRWDMSREFDLWLEPEEPVQAAAAPTAAAASLGPGRKYAVGLVPHPDVMFAAKPEQGRGAPDRYSGVMRLRVPADGLYRVSASAGVWIDVVAGATVVKSATFEMQTKCATIFKSVAFPLRGGTYYWLQLNGNRSPAVHVLVTPVRS